LSGDIREAVATAGTAAGGRNLLMPGANVTQQCLEADLVDEVLLFQLPVLLGDGIRLFGRPGYREVLFETILATRYGQAVALCTSGDGGPDYAEAS
jgi:dihydrofolate reductase